MFHSKNISRRTHGCARFSHAVGRVFFCCVKRTLQGHPLRFEMLAVCKTSVKKQQRDDEETPEVERHVRSTKIASHDALLWKCPEYQRSSSLSARPPFSFRSAEDDENVSCSRSSLLPRIEVWFSLTTTNQHLSEFDCALAKCKGRSHSIEDNAVEYEKNERMTFN